MYKKECPFCHTMVEQDQIRIDWEKEEEAFCELCEDKYIERQIINYDIEEII